MKQLFVFSLLVFGFYISDAQDQDAKKLYSTAKDYMKQGDYDNAEMVLNNALKLDPGSLDMLKDLAFVEILKRDFAKSIEISKVLVERDDADEQTFQILGMAYKAIAEYKECNKLYKKGLKKFPTSAVLYNEFGELLAMQKDLINAIQQWEKGIESDPEYSSNYYNAVNYYSKAGNIIPILIYGEIFLNLESYTTRTADIKALLLEAYKALYAGENFNKLIQDKRNNNFEKRFLETLQKSISLATGGITAESLTAIRTRFVLDWFHNSTKDDFPFRLFEHQRYLLSEGLFEAYNQWIFATAANPSAYQAWVQTHEKQAANFKAFQQSRVFRIPKGQYYLN